MHTILTSLGFDDTEAKVYVALLQSGPSTVSEITERAQITRTLGYHVLEKLSSYNLAHIVSRGTSIKYYEAAPPEKVVSFVEEKRREWELKVEKAKQNLPKLLALSQQDVIEPKHSVFFGEKALEYVSRETFINDNNVYSVVKMANNTSALATYMRNSQYITRISTQNALNIEVCENISTRYTQLPYVCVDKVPELADFFGEIRVYNNC